MTTSDALRMHGPGPLPGAARPGALNGAVDSLRRCRAMSCAAMSCIAAARP
ncbi:hypothetical protein ACIQWA_33495 [Kitasatospora sp. NPDC098652]|uniref:hypothetical protein n=1 Tax=Kitasatospora sp. NPDC098652 TaxID=3364095 RepID=UPI003823A131